ncbi:MAG: hypothetical protein A3F18_03790 [Legionellales bacterium RIFCSPHIGHO2_12_FULL_37_14]|nr:MAG: hypothetical protein A3F18_03790 [Legionellales bacterium RIFCSPHIGHO2_12_FULL_37_14]
MNVLECLGIYKSYATKASTTLVLENYSLSLKSGEIGMLMGPSGCGKTTLLMIAGGILTPEKGICKVYDQDIYALPHSLKVNFRAKNISFVFQHLHLLPALSAAENMALPLLIDGMEREIALEAANKMMMNLGIEKFINSKLDDLSGGQKQRIAIGRALIRKPKLVLCDEPTSNLDNKSAEVVFEIFQDYAKNHDSTFLICTHDQRIAHYAHMIFEFNRQ